MQEQPQDKSPFCTKQARNFMECVLKMNLKKVNYTIQMVIIFKLPSAKAYGQAKAPIVTLQVTSTPGTSAEAKNTVSAK